MSADWNPDDLEWVEPALPPVRRWQGKCREVLDEVFQERERQELRYPKNRYVGNGTGPEVKWLYPYTGSSAVEIEATLRFEYEASEAKNGLPTWLELVREEVSEAFMEEDPARLQEELIQVAALCVSWIEHMRVQAETSSGKG